MYEYVLILGSNYTFTVRTVNDAEESIRVSYRSQAVTCKTKAGG